MGIARAGVLRLPRRCSRRCRFGIGTAETHFRQPGVLAAAIVGKDLELEIPPRGGGVESDGLAGIIVLPGRFRQGICADGLELLAIRRSQDRRLFNAPTVPAAVFVVVPDVDAVDPACLAQVKHQPRVRVAVPHAVPVGGNIVRMHINAAAGKRFAPARSINQLTRRPPGLRLRAGCPGVYGRDKCTERPGRPGGYICRSDGGCQTQAEYEERQRITHEWGLAPP